MDMPEDVILPPVLLQSKRLLYVKTIVRLLRQCGIKYQQLLSNKEGISSFHTTVIELIFLIEKIANGRSLCII